MFNKLIFFGLSMCISFSAYSYDEPIINMKSLGDIKIHSKKIKIDNKPKIGVFLKDTLLPNESIVTNSKGINFIVSDPVINETEEIDSEMGSMIITIDDEDDGVINDVNILNEKVSKRPNKIPYVAYEEVLNPSGFIYTIKAKIGNEQSDYYQFRVNNDRTVDFTFGDGVFISVEKVFPHLLMTISNSGIYLYRFKKSDGCVLVNSAYLPYVHRDEDINNLDIIKVNLKPVLNKHKVFVDQYMSFNNHKYCTQ